MQCPLLTGMLGVSKRLCLSKLQIRSMVERASSVSYLILEETEAMRGA